MLIGLLGSMGMGVGSDGGVDVGMSMILETGLARSSLEAGWCVAVAVGMRVGVAVMASEVRWVGMFVMVMLMAVIEVGTRTVGALPDLLLFNLLDLFFLSLWRLHWVAMDMDMTMTTVRVRKHRTLLIVMVVDMVFDRGFLWSRYR